MKKKKKYNCRVCGRPTNHADCLCSKHYDQIKEYGYPLDDNPRCGKDPNEIVLKDNIAEIILYDNILFEEKDRAIIDKEDIEKVEGLVIESKQSCIIAHDKVKTILLANIIMDTELKVEFINGNYKDCRKENLRIVEKKSKKKTPYIVNKKNKNKIIVEIIGKNKHQVTGSSTLVSIPLKNGEYKKILIELGGNQTNKDLYTEYLMNKEIVESVPHNEIDYVFVCHSHYDHIGNLPALTSNGFNGKLISNVANERLMLPILLDGAFIMNKNVRSINNKKHNIEPLYTEEDVYLLMNKCETYSMNEIHKLDDIISFQFVNAGHILGSCQLVLYIKTPTGQVKKLHFTSDLGSDYNKQPFVEPKDIITSSNFSLFEGTYNDLNRGFKNKKEFEKEREEFKKFIKEELKQNRNILIGVFAQARQQTMMQFLYECFKDDKEFNYNIYIDGVLGLSLNNVYLSVLQGEEKEYWKEILSWDKFNYIGSYVKSLEVAYNKDETKIILSSSGMFNNGRIVNHVKAMIENPKNTFVLCGYQGEGTVGHELQKTDTKEVKVEGMTYKKRCKIYQMSTWSSHIMPLENIKYMAQINTPLIVINHSDDNKYKFRDIVEDELRQRNNSAKVICADDDNNIFFI